MRVLAETGVEADELDADPNELTNLAVGQRNRAARTAALDALVDEMTRADAHTFLFEFIEIFYNRQRHQAGLGHLTPAEYADKWRHDQGHDLS